MAADRDSAEGRIINFGVLQIRRQNCVLEYWALYMGTQVGPMLDGF
jgi:hypothetical protein